MFHNIPNEIAVRMAFLERQDARDREDGTPRMQRLRQIPPETGKFLTLMAAGSPQGEWLEIGASGGYSTLWIALAAREAGRKVTTFELLEDKARLAKETYAFAAVGDVVELVEGDARRYLPRYKRVAFCFLDAEKEVYADCYETVVPNLVAGGLLIADNAINQRDILAPVLERALSDPRVDALIVPVGKGVLLCRKL